MQLGKAGKVCRRKANELRTNTPRQGATAWRSVKRESGWRRRARTGERNDEPGLAIVLPWGYIIPPQKTNSATIKKMGWEKKGGRRRIADISKRVKREKKRKRKRELRDQSAIRRQRKSCGLQVTKLEKSHNPKKSGKTRSGGGWKCSLEDDER